MFNMNIVAYAIVKVVPETCMTEDYLSDVSTTKQTVPGLQIRSNKGLRVRECYR